MISAISRRHILRTVKFQSPPILSCKYSSRLLSTATDLPYHTVMGMPALSPTMEAGTIASWKISEGESFSAGDSLAEIETDKATIDFEAQDDGVIAKILVDAGSSEVAVGVPVLVVVEEEEDVEAFRDYVAEVPAEEKEAKEDVPVQAAVEPVVVPVEEPPAAVVVPEPVAPEPVVAAPVEAIAAPEDVVSQSLISPSWGNLARTNSPLASTLAKNQKSYIDLYGSTGQVPL